MYFWGRWYLPFLKNLWKVTTSWQVCFLPCVHFHDSIVSLRNDFNHLILLILYYSHLPTSSIDLDLLQCSFPWSSGNSKDLYAFLVVIAKSNSLHPWEGLCPYMLCFFLTVNTFLPFLSFYSLFSLFNSARYHVSILSETVCASSAIIQ